MTENLRTPIAAIEGSTEDMQRHLEADMQSARQIRAMIGVLDEHIKDLVILAGGAVDDANEAVQIIAAEQESRGRLAASATQHVEFARSLERYAKDHLEGTSNPSAHNTVHALENVSDATAKGAGACNTAKAETDELHKRAIRLRTKIKEAMSELALVRQQMDIVTSAGDRAVEYFVEAADSSNEALVELREYRRDVFGDT